MEKDIFVEPDNAFAVISRDWKSWAVQFPAGTKMVIGISGGVDSTCAAALACRLFGPENVVGVSLPCDGQKDMADVDAVFEHLKIRRVTIDIGDAFFTLKDGIENNAIGLTEQCVTNMPARLRMTALFGVAQCLGGVVINTCNRSESICGYDTLFGDSCGCSQSLEHINEKLRALGTERWNIETILTRVSMFSGTMASIGDENEVKTIIHEFVHAWDIRELYLCVDPSICRNADTDSEREVYPKEMLLLFGIRNGKTYETQMLQTRDLAPALLEMRKNASCLVFCPLYYRDRNFGYVAMNHGSGTGAALYSVLMLLNGTLMSLYLQTNLKRSSATIERMASHDIMTGMLNRRGYMELAPAELEKAGKDGKLFTLLSADMDHMKDINDRHGHLMGDEAICRMGRVLQKLDELHFTPVHISGDEFIAYGTTESVEEAEMTVRFVHDELDRLNREDPWICNISASIGYYAAVPEEGDTIDTFVTMADRAMYADKNRKKYGRRKDDIKPLPE